MILCHPQLDNIIDFSSQEIPSLVIESPSFYRQLLMDLYAQRNGEDGVFVLSENEKPLSISGWVEIIDNYLQFDLNSKTLLNKISSAMETIAMNEQNFMRTANILQQLEQYIDELTFSFDCDIVCNRCSVGGILKGVGISLRDDYENELERIIDYMELVREFERDKLFIFVNLRSFFNDIELNVFLNTISAHGFHALLLDNFCREKLCLEKRVTVDNDLCEF